MLRTRLLPLALSVWALPLTAQGGLTTPFEPVLTLGRPAPRLSSVYTDFGRGGAIRMAHDGDITFGALSTRWALLMGRNKEHVSIAIEEGTEPSGTLRQVTVGDSSLGRSVRGGRLAVLVPLRGAVLPGVDDRAIYEGAPWSLRLVVRLGDAAPAGGASLSGLGLPVFDPGGKLAFPVDLAGGDVFGVTNDTALVVDLAGNRQFLVRGGDAVNGGQQLAGRVFDGVFREDGSMLVRMSLSRIGGLAPATAADDWALCLRHLTGSVTSVLREGDPVLPGGGRVGDRFRIADTDPRGAFLVTGSAAGDDYVLYFDSTATLRFALANSAPLQGLSGLILQTVSRAALTDDALLVEGRVNGPGIGAANDAVILSVDRVTGAAVILAQEGDPAPFAASGLVLGEVPFRDPFGMVANRTGQFLMRAFVRDVGTFRVVLYGFDPWAGFFLLSELPGGVRQYEIRAYDLSDTGDVVIDTIGVTPALDTVFRTHIGSFFGVPSAIEAAAGGSHGMEIEAGPSLAGLPYFIAGSTSGTWPGFPVTAAVQIPLNLDPWTSASFGAINNVFSANFGVLDGTGFAQSTMTVPPGVPQLSGLLFHHAYAVVGPGPTLRHVSEPVSLQLF